MVRNRPRKPRLARMDAAVDAMSEFGFPEKKVKKHVRLLLKVYGGDDGWHFIEEYSYKELLDAMLRDVEEEQETKALKDGSNVGTSTRDEGPQDNSSPENTAIMPSGASTQPESSQTNNASSPTDQIISGMSTLQPANSLPQGGPCYGWIESDDEAVQPANSLPPHGAPSKPCYGWIESDEDEDEDDFVYLKKMPGHFGEKGVAATVGSREKRRSRWDLKPEDP